MSDEDEDIEFSKEDMDSTAVNGKNSERHGARCIIPAEMKTRYTVAVAPRRVN